MNLLETEQEILEYKKWLSSKPCNFLKCLKGIFEIHLEMKKTKYPNLILRMNLLDEEMKRKCFK